MTHVLPSSSEELTKAVPDWETKVSDECVSLQWMFTHVARHSCTHIHSSHNPSYE